MAVVSNLIGLKASLKFDRGSQTISRLNSNATDQNIFDLAMEVQKLHQGTVENVYKVEEFDLVME